MTEKIGTVFVKNVNVKSYAKELGVRMSVDFVDSLDDEVQKMVYNAVYRAKLNDRLTVMKRDL